MNIIQTYQTFADFNQTTPDSFLVYSNTIWPYFTPMILFVMFMILLFTSIAVQRRIGSINLAGSFAASSFATFVTATMFTLKDGLINTTTLTITFLILVISAAWFLASSDSF